MITPPTAIDTLVPGRRIEIRDTSIGPSLRITNTDTGRSINANLTGDEPHRIAAALRGREPGDEYVDWKTMYDQARSERDAAVARAEAAERVLRERDEQENDATRAACERAEAAEKRLRRFEARPWGVVLDHNKVGHFLPAVTRDEMDKALTEHSRMAFGVPVVSVEEAVEVVAGLVSGSDPAVHVVRESDLPTVSRGEDEHWRDEGGKYVVWGTHTLESARANVKIQLRHAAEFEAVARAIEAGQAADPVEEQTDALADILYGDELVTDQMRGVLERVVRARVLFPEQEASSDE